MKRAMFCLALGLLLLSAPGAWAQSPDEVVETGKKLRPEFHRDGNERRPGDSRPTRPQLPGDLLLEEPAAEPAPAEVQGSTAASKAAPGRTAQPGNPFAEIDRLARREARWAAEEWARTVGWNEYYRIGAQRGMRQALRNQSLGQWDYLLGMRTGLRDRDAVATGADYGRDSARGIAYKNAEADVADTFRDLSRDPRFDARPLAPPFGAADVRAEEPTLREVFDEYAPSRRRGVATALVAAFRGYKHDLWTLYNYDNHRRFHDRDWSDPSRGFRFWCEDRRRSRIYHSLDRGEQRRFEESFRRAFARTLPRYFDRYNQVAFDDGYDDGWDYGAMVRYEYRYRIGYTEGFNDALESAAQASFQASYAPEYERAYADAFRDWSENPHFEVVNLELVDQSDDGIFEPGESFRVFYEIANYGGRDGTFEARLDGNGLRDTTQPAVRVAARSISDRGAPLEGWIDSSVAPRTRSRLSVGNGEAVGDIDLLVSYPLEFVGGVRMGRIDSIAGTAEIEVEVANRSRRQAAAWLVLTDGRGGREVLDLSVHEQSNRQAGFSLDGLDPIDVIAGRVRLELRLENDAKLYDQADYRLPDLSADLNNDELLRLMVAGSNDDVPLSLQQIEELRGLLMTRLRVDWRAAVRARGNPYKYDYKQGATSTALGTLVDLVQNDGSLRRSRVFQGLDGEVLALVRDLPGTHPFLRKNAKRLAKKLP